MAWRQAVAPITYLSTFQDTGDQRTIDGFAVARYVVGSVLFLAGGAVNHWRAWPVADGVLRHRRVT